MFFFCLFTRVGLHGFLRGEAASALSPAPCEEGGSAYFFFLLPAHSRCFFRVGPDPRARYFSEAPSFLGWELRAPLGFFFFGFGLICSVPKRDLLFTDRPLAVFFFPPRSKSN